MKLRTLRNWRWGKILGYLFVFWVAAGVVIHSFRPSDQHTAKLVNIEAHTNFVRLRLDDGREFNVSLDSPIYNSKNLMLLYPGKNVWIGPGASKVCTYITPVRQRNMPRLTLDQYNDLVHAGLRDEDIALSYKLPDGAENPNPARSSFGGFVEYGAPPVCATAVTSNNQP